MVTIHRDSAWPHTAPAVLWTLFLPNPQVKVEWPIRADKCASAVSCGTPRRKPVPERTRPEMLAAWGVWGDLQSERERLKNLQPRQQQTWPSDFPHSPKHKLLGQC